MEGYRKELKYIVSDAMLMDVANRINGLMHIDKHQKNEYYRIRSIYLDTPDYKCFRENQAGISNREKYRIRTYDCSDNLILAEIKIRRADTISKMSAHISKKTLDAIVAGNISEITACLAEEIEKAGTPDERMVLEKYLVRIAGEHYLPAVIVDYERTAYVYDTCNVRITFDRNVTASTEYGRFFDSSIPGRVAIDDSLHVLEIKYDEFLPDEIAAVLSGLGLTRCSCSKYARCLERIRL